MNPLQEFVEDLYQDFKYQKSLIVSKRAFMIKLVILRENLFDILFPSSYHNLSNIYVRLNCF